MRKELARVIKPDGITPTMKVFIVGAGGVASALAREFSMEKGISQVVCGTNGLGAAKGFFRGIAGKKVALVALDAANEKQLVEATKGFSLIINASLPQFNLRIMEAALKNKCHYMDLCSYLGGLSNKLADLKDVEQLRMDKRFRKAGLIGLINTGVAPGVTNLVARELSDKLDKVDTITFRLVEEQVASDFVMSWSPEVTLDELSAPPLFFVNGKFKLVKGFDEPEDYDFPKPIGKFKVYNVYGDEVSTIPRYIKVKNVIYKSGGSDIAASKMLFDLGFMEKKPVLVSGKKVAPLELLLKMIPRPPAPREMERLVRENILKNAYFASSVEVVGLRKRQKKKVTATLLYPDLKKVFSKMKGASYIAYPTAISAFAFAMIIPTLKERGVFPPEALGRAERAKVLGILKKRGVVILNR